MRRCEKCLWFVLKDENSTIELEFIRVFIHPSYFLLAWIKCSKVPPRSSQNCESCLFHLISHMDPRNLYKSLHASWILLSLHQVIVSSETRKGSWLACLPWLSSFSLFSKRFDLEALLLHSCISSTHFWLFSRSDIFQASCYNSELFGAFRLLLLLQGHFSCIFLWTLLRNVP